MAEALSVVLGGEVAGRITRAGAFAEPVFTYDDDYLVHGRVPLSTRIPIGSGAFRGMQIVPFLEGLVPENGDTRRLWAERLGVENDDAFSLLARMGWDCPGAVQFSNPDELDEMRSRANKVKRSSEADIEERLRTLRDDSAAWALPDEHWSLPGQQEKFALVLRDGRWYTAKGSAATTHIIKPGIGRLHHQALVEYATMRAARDVGLDVATVEFAHFGQEPAIVIERFDRVLVSGEMVRVHQEDFCQAVGVLPERKYEEHNGPSLARLGEVITRHSSDREADHWALAEFAAINYVSGAPDGHAKNISLALWPDDIHVAPLYDLATSFPYEDRSPATRKSAFSIGGRREFGKVMGKHWDRAAADMKVDAAQYRRAVRMMATPFPDAFADALDQTGLPEASHVRERTMPRLQRHIDDLVARLDDPPDPGPKGRRQGQGGTRRGKTTPASNNGSFKTHERGEADVSLD
jgi:serine/threonine-protein kinase HipA